MTGKIRVMIRKRGFGFITPDTDEKGNVFFHATVTEDFQELNKGDTVSYDQTQTPKGTKASNVRLIKGDKQ